MIKASPQYVIGNCEQKNIIWTTLTKKLCFLHFVPLISPQSNSSTPFDD
jgi:hypothetical protein